MLICGRQNNKEKASVNMGLYYYSHQNKQSVFTKKMGEFKHSDAPDAKGKFRDLSASALASWLIKTRDGNLKKIIGSLNQQYVFLALIHI